MKSNLGFSKLMGKMRNEWKLGSMEMLTAAPTGRPQSARRRPSPQVRVLAGSREKKGLALAIALITPTLPINGLPAAPPLCAPFCACEPISQLLFRLLT